VVREAQAQGTHSADVEYYYGSALAQLGRWDDAAKAFRRGLRLAPDDKRFPIELGGVAYKQKHHREALTWLRRGIELDPFDSYANDFLATIYFVHGNLEAALKYWNRIKKPFIEEIQTDRELKIRPVLLDRAFAFSPANELRLSDYRTTKRRLEGLGIFALYRISLVAGDDTRFAATFYGKERNGA